MIHVLVQWRKLRLYTYLSTNHGPNQSYLYHKYYKHSNESSTFAVFELIGVIGKVAKISANLLQHATYGGSFFIISWAKQIV